VVQVSRILAIVTTKTRRRISTPEELRKVAPSLLDALDEAEEIEKQHHVGGPMDFTTLVG
jgi:hypothetical protein